MELKYIKKLFRYTHTFYILLTLKYKIMKLPDMEINLAAQ